MDRNYGYLLFLIVVRTVCSKTESATCGTDMRTDKNVYTIGEIIHLTCSTKYAAIPDPSLFYIMHCTRENPTGTNVSTLFTTTANGFSTDIVVRNKSDAGTYICYYSNCKTILLTSLSDVRVLDIPQNLKRPKLDCVTNSQWNTTCTWDGMDNQANIAWKMAFKREGTRRYICCTGPNSACDTFTSYTMCYLTNTQFQRYRTYQFQLTANYGENHTFVYNYTITANDSLLRCHIGDSLQLSPNVVRMFDLKADIDCVPSAVGGVVCNVTTVPRIAPYTIVSKDFTSYSDALNVRGFISGLDPFMIYNVSLRCRPSGSRHWSNTLHAVNSTLPEPPIASSEVIGYSEITGGEDRADVILYIKHIGRFYGRKPEYVVDFDFNSASDPLVFNSFDTTAELKSLNSSQTYMLRLTSRNEAGPSTTSTVFEIPQTLPGREVTIVVDQGGDAGIVNIISFGNKVLAGAHKTCYFTCTTDEDTVPPKCKTTATRQCMDGFHSSHIISEHHDTKANTAYGVSLKTNDNNTDKIVWSSCIFHPERRREWNNLPVTGKLTNHSTVELVLGFDYCLLQKRPLVYQIEVPDILAIKNCTFEDAINITATPTLKSIPVDVSGHKQHLVICFRALYSDDSFDLADDITVALETPPDASTNESDTINLIIGITTGVAVCCLIGLLYCLQRYRRRLQSRNQVKDILKDIVQPTQRDTMKEQSLHAPDTNCSANEGEESRQYTCIQLQNLVKGPITQSSACIIETINTEPQVKEIKNIIGDQKDKNTNGDRKIADKCGKFDENQNDTLKAVTIDTDKRGVSSMYLDRAGIQVNDDEQKKKLVYYLQTLNDQIDTRTITLHNQTESHGNNEYLFEHGGDVYGSASRIAGIRGSESPCAGTSGIITDSQIDSYAFAINIMGSGQSLPDDYVISAEVTSSCS